MREVHLTPDAQKDLRRMPADRAEQVLAALKRLAATEHGDVRATKGALQGAFRLRVGSYRVLLTLERDAVLVHRVVPRGSAYKE